MTADQELPATALVISLTVITRDPNAAARAYEVIGRAAVGIALEGVQVGTNISTIEDIVEEDET